MTSENTVKNEVGQLIQYEGGFQNWGDVSEEFTPFSGNWAADDLDIKNRRAAIPIPEEVIYAGYIQEDYSGDAYIVFRNGEKFFTVEGSHCSCYGLEEQWAPEEYTLQSLIFSLEKSGENDWSLAGKINKALLENLRPRI